MRFCLLFALCGCSATANLSSQDAAPEVVITSHQDGDEILEGQTVTFFATASDLDNNSDELTVAWQLGGYGVCEGAALDGGGLTQCEMRVGPNDDQIRVTVSDPVARTGTAAVDLTVIATAAPTVAIFEPLSHLPLYTDRDVSFSGLVQDAEDGPEALSIEWKSDLDGVLTDVLTLPDADGTIQGYGHLTEGEHALTLTVVDTQEKVSSDSVVVTVQPPNLPPECSIASPDADTSFVVGDSVTFLGEATDPNLDPNLLDVSWTSDIQTGGLLGTSLPDSFGIVQFTTADLELGTHTVSLTVSDELDVSCVTSVVLVVTPPPEAPTVAILTPAPSALVNIGDVVSFVAWVEDPDTAPEDLDIEWTSDRESGKLSTEDADTSGNVEFFTDELSAGLHQIKVKVTDPTGLSAKALQALLVNAGPSAPTLSMTATATTTEDVFPTLDVAAVDPEGDIVSYGYSWLRQGAGNPASTSATLDHSLTERGQTWTVTVMASDEHGAPAPVAEASVEIINTPPAIVDVDFATTPTALESIECVASATDDDGDVVDFDFGWEVVPNGLTGLPDPSAVTSDTLPSSYFGAGADVTCIATPSDHDATGSSDSITATVLDCVNALWYEDQDEDGYGDPDTEDSYCGDPSTVSTTYVLDDKDCDDLNDTVHPGAEERCDGVDTDCTGGPSSEEADVDDDDYVICEPTTWLGSGTKLGGECDDLEEDVHPGADETCNEVDDDCDGSVDEEASDADTYFADGDGDGFGDSAQSQAACDAPWFFVDNDDDCDDHDGQLNPDTVWFKDDDKDGFGTDATTQTACLSPGAKWSRVDGDCDEAHDDAYPGAEELCDGYDNNCNGLVDQGATDAEVWYLDADQDGEGDSNTTFTACDEPALFVDNADDCDDSDAALNQTTIWYLDTDTDGFGDDATATTQCESPLGNYVLIGGDCEPSDILSAPGFEEVCRDGDDNEGVDNNCDGDVDEGCSALHCGDITADETWDASQHHLITCDVSVAGTDEPVLTISGGAVIEVEAGATLWIGDGDPGGLDVLGATVGVSMSSAAASPAAGDWGGVAFGEEAVESIVMGLSVQHATVGIDVLATSLTLADVVLIDLDDAGLRAEGTTLNVSDLQVRDAAIGVDADGGTVNLNDVTVQSVSGGGVSVLNADITASGMNVSDAGATGIHLSGAFVDLYASQAVGCGGNGVVVESTADSSTLLVNSSVTRNNDGEGLRMVVTHGMSLGTIRGVTVRDNGQYGVQVDQSGNPGSAVVVQDSILEGSGWANLFANVPGSQGTTWVQGNIIRDSGQATSIPSGVSGCNISMFADGDGSAELSVDQAIVIGGPCGVHLLALDGASPELSLQSLTLVGSAGDGVRALVEGDGYPNISIDGGSVSGHAGYGVFLEQDSQEGQVRLYDVQVDGNGLDGLDIDGWETAELSRVQADDNGGLGLRVNASYVYMYDSEFRDNDAQGLVMTGTGQVWANDTWISDSSDDGVVLGPDITVSSWQGMTSAQNTGAPIRLETLNQVLAVAHGNASGTYYGNNYYSNGIPQVWCADCTVGASVSLPAFDEGLHLDQGLVVPVASTVNLSGDITVGSAAQISVSGDLSAIGGTVGASAFTGAWDGIVYESGSTGTLNGIDVGWSAGSNITLLSPSITVKDSTIHDATLWGIDCGGSGCDGTYVYGNSYNGNGSGNEN
jgi:hypothetical protein